MPKPFTQDADVGEPMFGWTVQEYEKHDRRPLWFVIMGAIALGCILYGLFSGNFLFALVIILSAIILYLQAHGQPAQVHFVITDAGIVLGNRFYPYTELESFYIIYQPPHVQMLYFETSSVFRPLIRIPILDMNPVDIRLTLLEFLDEDVEKEEEPLSDQFARNWQIH